MEPKTLPLGLHSLLESDLYFLVSDTFRLTDTVKAIA